MVAMEAQVNIQTLLALLFKGLVVEAVVQIKSRLSLPAVLVVAVLVVQTNHQWQMEFLGRPLRGEVVEAGLLANQADQAAQA